MAGDTDSPTHIEIEFKCGHRQLKDLSDKKAKERESFASWLFKNQSCTDCFIKNKQQQSKREWQKEQLEEKAEALEDQERSGLPVLSGTEKQVQWAVTIRFKILRAAYEIVVGENGLSDSEFEKHYLEPAKKISAAKWWIENRDIEPDLLADEIATIESDESMVLENPF